MSDVKKIFSEKKFPTFITSHNVFKTFKEVNKVFPEIGLPNSETEIEVDNKKEAKDSANQLLSELKHMVDERLRTINKYGTKKAEAMGPKRKKKLDNINKLLNSVQTNLAKAKTKCLTEQGGKITLNLPADVLDGENKVIFKSGEGLFRVYNKLNEVLRAGHFLPMEKYENLQQFKDFSSKNVPALKYKVRFASDGSEGAWDIATMSMRGISSCQTWGAGNSSHIVGSVVDPFTGIIYLTSGNKFNEYGTKMIRRCVVRFVVDENKKVPFIALERMYPSMERGALDAFINFLKEQTDNKFDVIYLPELRRASVYVPMSKIVGALNAYDQPYRDSQIQYKTDINKHVPIKNKVSPKLEAINSSIAAKVVATARAMKLATIPAESKAAFKSLRGSDYMWDSSYELYESIRNNIIKFFSGRKIDNYTDGDLYLKESIEVLLSDNFEDRIYNAIKESTKKIPASRGIIDDSVIKDLTKLSCEKLSVYLGNELKKIKIVECKATTKKNSAESAIPIYTKLLG